MIDPETKTGTEEEEENRVKVERSSLTTKTTATSVVSSNDILDITIDCDHQSESSNSFFLFLAAGLADVVLATKSSYPSSNRLPFGLAAGLGVFFAIEGKSSASSSPNRPPFFLTGSAFGFVVLGTISP